MLKEYTQPVTKPIDGDKNVFSVLVERAERKPDEPLVSYKDGTGSWRSFTAAEFRDKVIALAKGLIARGVMPGDAVSIISSTSWQWAALDMAIMSIGSLTVPVYETNSPAQVATIFNDSQVTMAFAENRVRPLALQHAERRVRHRFRCAEHAGGIRARSE